MNPKLDIFHPPWSTNGSTRLVCQGGQLIGTIYRAPSGWTSDHDPMMHASESEAAEELARLAAGGAR